MTARRNRGLAPRAGRRKLPTCHNIADRGAARRSGKVRLRIWRAFPTTRPWSADRLTVGAAFLQSDIAGRHSIARYRSIYCEFAQLHSTFVNFLSGQRNLLVNRIGARGSYATRMPPIKCRAAARYFWASTFRCVCGLSGYSYPMLLGQPAVAHSSSGFVAFTDPDKKMLVAQLLAIAVGRNAIGTGGKSNE